MSRRPQNIPSAASRTAGDAKTHWTKLGIDAAQAGDYETAIDLFVTAISYDKRNAGLRYNLALALHRNGEIDDAAVALTEALRLKPGMVPAAERLSQILERYEISDPERLEAVGLLNAMSSRAVYAQPLGMMAFRLLKTAGPLGEILARSDREGWDSVALQLIESQTAPLLRDPLFLLALLKHVNQDAQIERLLTALRRALLQLDADRFTDKSLVMFSIALAEQCIINDHVFEVSEDEKDAVNELLDRVEPDRKPEPSVIQSLMCALMYHPFDAVVAAAEDREDFSQMRPKLVRDLINSHLDHLNREEEILEQLDESSFAHDDIAQKLSTQHEHRPYPRWTAMRRPTEGALVKALERFVPAARLSFLQQPFDVLVTGCGTGRQAIQSAIGYGENAQIHAVDLSRRNLAYATRTAQDHEVQNITFTHANLLDPDFTDKSYDIIECVGVLHHLADPLAGLKAVSNRLKPGGLMLLGLYSAVSREEISELRLEPGFPGSDCDDQAARAYRGSLLKRAASETGGELTNAIDFWSLSGFRNLVLHVHEQQFRLPEIESALNDAGLEFRGFGLHPQTIREFETAFPDDAWPGTLANWWTYEQDRPRLFDGMYVFWVEKVQSSESG